MFHGTLHFGTRLGGAFLYVGSWLFGCVVVCRVLYLLSSLGFVVVSLSFTLVQFQYQHAKHHQAPTHNAKRTMHNSNIKNDTFDYC